jgi:hypothetical protein
MLTITPARGRFGSLYYMDGTSKKVLGRKLPMSTADELQALQSVVANAQRNYPQHALKLDVNQASGSALLPIETLDLSQIAFAGPEIEEMTHVATRPPATPGLPPGIDHMTAYLLQLSQNQVVEKDGLIIDLRADKQRLEQEKRDLETKLTNLEFELKGKDRDHEYALRDAVANTPKGMAGFGEAVAPFLSPELVNMLASKFLGTPTPAASAAPQLGSHLSDKHRQTVQALSEWASESEANADALYAIIRAALTRPTGLEEIMAFVQTSFNQISA